MRVPLAPTPLVVPPQKPVAAMDLQFSGEHDKVELSAANFMKKLNMLHRTNKTPEAEKFIDVADRFEEDSPAEKWFNNLQATVPTPAAASDWAAVQTAFKARFKGAPPVLKPVAQLEDELSPGTVEVRGRQVYVLADFVERLTDAVVAVNTLTSAVGLWGFHAALPHVLQSAVGVMPANWLAMTTVLGAIPQSVIALAIADYKEKRSTKADVEDLKKVFSSLRVASSAARSPNPSSAPLSPTVETAVATTALKGVGCKGEATAEQKEQLRKVLKACIARRHPNTPTGLAEYTADIRTWDRKFGSIARTQLRLELTGYPLTPGVADPCTGECWACGVGTTPLHEKTPEGCKKAALPALETAIRLLGGMWLGHTNLKATAAAVNHVVVDPAVVMGLWFDGEREEARGEEDFVEGLQE
ncbi:hypothetical protein DFH09DRAFT_1349420 [Mycena vulgaris]|nr:hypothetical protein DFH09DRAFT_1349420 [Mycena vulgaris]